MWIYSKLIKQRILHCIKISSLVRCLSETAIRTDEGNSFFITTPIFYVNSSPHLGHFYTLCLADAVARFEKLIGKQNIIFSTGTDEHGLKVQQAAKAQGLDPRALCDSISPLFRRLCDFADISYTDFIRTTEDRHMNVASLFFEKLNSDDFIYKGKYEGWYSVSEESFIPRHQVKEEVLPSGEIKNVTIVGGHAVHWTSESNYMFKMSRLRDDLVYWLRNDAHISPALFHTEALLITAGDIPDLSISRSERKLSWGIPVPGDKSHTLYVWFEALLNYLTVVGYPNMSIWPPSCQVLGKDILKFHAIYWPALLIAAGLEPPRRLLVHSHWTLEGHKMSKSKGNVVCPFDLINKLSSDAFRYYLLRTGVPHSDGNWCQESAINTINAELANSLGNLLNRCVGQNLNPNQELPQVSQHFLTNSSETCKLLLKLIDELPAKIEDHFSSYNFNRGIDEVMEMVRLANAFIQEEEPWKLKNCENRSNLDSILHIGMVASQAAAIALQPIIPTLTKNALDSLNVPVESRRLKDIHSLSCAYSPPRKLCHYTPFFKRLQL